MMVRRRRDDVAARLRGGNAPAGDPKTAHLLFGRGVLLGLRLGNGETDGADQKGKTGRMVRKLKAKQYG